MTMASILQFIWPLPDKGLSKRLYRVKAPTLLSGAPRTALVDPAYVRTFACGHHGARLEVVDGAGHLPQLEQAERTVPLITEFLA